MPKKRKSKKPNVGKPKSRKPKQLIVRGEKINADLSLTPHDSVEAKGYRALYKLLKAAYEKVERGTWKTKSDEGFAAWDLAVLKLLRDEEGRRFEKPLRPEMAEVRGFRSGDPSSRLFHLTKILWARQGIEKNMTDTGY